jgi:hypothetical protein
MSLDQHLENIKKSLYDDMEKSQQVIFDGLVNNVSINTIPETIFVNYFIPCFLGNNPGSGWIVEWVSIAGTPMAEVGVVKDGTRELLFKVPGLLSTNSLILNNDNADLGDIFKRYDQINNNIPSSGLSFLVQALNTKNEQLLSNYTLSDARSRWIEILKRYGFIQQTITGLVEVNDSNIDDFLEY